MSEMGSVISLSTLVREPGTGNLDPGTYQELFVTPVTSPSSASLRKHRRHMSNLRMNARGRPHSLQRLRCRVLNFSAFFSRAIFAVVAIYVRASIRRSIYALVGPERDAHQLQQLARFLVGLGAGDHRHVHAARLVHFHVVDLREQQLVAEA